MCGTFSIISHKYVQNFLLVPLGFWMDFDDGVFLFGGEQRFLDDQFAQLKKLQDASSPDFVFEVVSLFFQNSEKVINIMAEAL